MVDVLLVLVFASPILAGGLLGYRAGAGRLLSMAGPLFSGWACAILAAAAAFKAGWFQPLGLLTPALVGLLLGLAVHRIARRPLRDLLERASRRVSPHAPRMVQRTAGVLLGSAGGLAVAVSLWWMSLFAAGWIAGSQQIASPAPCAQEDPGMVFALLRTANRGFVRHLPLVGPVGDEMEALGFILNVDEEVRARLARELGWDGIADLSTFRAIMDDAGIVEEIELVRQGRVDALYRLQRHPKIIAFFMEEEVQRIVSQTRPTIVAKKLESLQASRSPPGGALRVQR